MAGYCGLSLDAWRALYRWIRGMEPRFGRVDGNPAAESATRHRAILLCAAALLDAEWHAAHPGRLAPDWRQRLMGRVYKLPQVHRSFTRRKGITKHKGS